MIDASPLFKVVSTMTKSSPRFRGIGRACRLFNSVMLRYLQNPHVETRMRDGTRMLVDLKNPAQTEAYYLGTYENTEISLIKSLIDEGSVFIDVGANIGFYSIAIASLFARRGSSGAVVAFEPLTANAQRLIENAVLNNLTTRITVYQCGLSDAAGHCNITLREDFSDGATTGNAAIPTDPSMDLGFPTEPIRLDVFDEVWQHHDKGAGRIDFMKIDIEGHEDFCLRGSRKTVAAHRPTILMEVNKAFYAARKVDVDQIFYDLIPPDYEKYLVKKQSIRRISAFAECGTLDNVLFIPNEKRSLASYRNIF